MDRQTGELDHPDSGPVEDAEPSQSTQATADEEPTQSTQPMDDSRSEHTLDASPIPGGVPHNTGMQYKKIIRNEKKKKKKPYNYIESYNNINVLAYTTRVS